MEKGLDVYVYDELFAEEEILGMGLKFIEPVEADFVFDGFKLVMI
jgi:UDP-N-acetyl-D-mannosaminuronic acid dehydrogenase